jgi:hypothetical protein
MACDMEFLAIILTENSSLLLHTIHSPFYGQFLRKNHPILWF